MLAVGMTLAAFTAGISPASAAIENIDGVALAGGGASTWDAQNPNTGSTCSDVPDGAYTPVEDGAVGGNADGFDGGLMLSIGGTAFVDSNDQGDRVGAQLIAGPELVNGMQVTTTARAMGTGTAVLRYIVKLKNTDPVNPVTREIELSSDLGSDQDSMVEATGSGDLLLTNLDRSIITSDGATFEDPLVSHIFFGPGTPLVKTQNIINTPGEVDEEDCLMVDFNVTLAPNASKSLLFFAELTPVTGASPLVTAQAGLTKYSAQKKLTGAGLLTGIGTKTFKSYLNWKLVAPRTRR